MQVHYCLKRNTYLYFGTPDGLSNAREEEMNSNVIEKFVDLVKEIT
jgi:hypothetical protein